VRVRGHSRFLRRRGDFVDLHFNRFFFVSKVCSFEEEEGRETREEKKKEKKKKFARRLKSV